MVKWLKNEFWNGYTLFEKLFMLSMILLQVIVYCFVPDTPIGIICGIAGCICVVLTAKGKISSYIFNFYPDDYVYGHLLGPCSLS